MRVLNPSPNKSVVAEIEASLGLIFPEFKDAKIIETWAGMVETTPDVVPIICESDEVPGFFISTGFSGHGFGIGPAAGQAIARMIENKGTTDLAPFRLKRFFDGSPIRPNSTI
jgi:glycine/D-amino acid oxidase-like deaminating enzyme